MIFTNIDVDGERRRPTSPLTPTRPRCMRPIWSCTWSESEGRLCGCNRGISSCVGTPLKGTGTCPPLEQ